MIIECINCNKKFNVDTNLIPSNGRQIQCGSCDHSWYHNVEKPSSETFVLDKKNNQQAQVFGDTHPDSFIKKTKNNPEKKSTAYNDSKNLKNEIITEHKRDIKISAPGKFFSYLIVFIITFVALVILVDTIRSPLISIFPFLEIFLFNLFETLKDIKLFIIDLT